MSMTGQQAYEEDVRRHPNHHDGTPRPDWDKLLDIAKWSWNRNPTPRDWKTPAEAGHIPPVAPTWIGIDWANPEQSIHPPGETPSPQ